MERTIIFKRELFSFASFRDWVNTGYGKFKNCNVNTRNCIYLDSMGRACTIGKHFKRAEIDSTYPITVYEI